MKVVLFANSTWAIPALLKLNELKWLTGLVTTKGSAQDTLNDLAQQMNVPSIVVDAETINDDLIRWLGNLAPEMGLCVTFPYLIPAKILSIPQWGVFNVHFGELPEYAGPDPLFWILNNGEKAATLVVHKMASDFDSGPVVFKEQLAIFPGENYGLLGARLSQLVASVMPKLEQNVKQHILCSKGVEPVLKPRPAAKDITIDWHQHSSEQIEAIVNAANPGYGGAVAYFRNAAVRILEVSPASVNDAPLFSPGSIVHASAEHGLFVLCKDHRFLRINVLQTPECIISGAKMAALGIRSGEKFT